MKNSIFTLLLLSIYIFAHAQHSPTSAYYDKDEEQEDTNPVVADRSFLLNNALPLFWSDDGTNKIQTMSNGVVQDVVVGLSSPQGVAVDTSNQKIYWTDRGTRRVSRADISGTNVEDLITTGLLYPAGIALDIEGGKMYWADWTLDKLMWADLDGTNVADFITSQDGPFGIALNIEQGKIYWINQIERNIKRANLDGSNIELLFTSTTNGLFDIVLDLDEDKMYWSHWGQNSITKANFDGANVEVLLSNIGNPDGLALDLQNSKILWADVVLNKIRKANLDGTNIEDVVTGLSDPLMLSFNATQAYSINTCFNNTEICGNNIDDNCNGLIDEGCMAVCDPTLTHTSAHPFFSNIGIASYNDKVYMIIGDSVIVSDLSGNRLYAFGGSGTGDGFLDTNSPQGIEFDHNGNLFIGDDGNHRVQAFDENGNYLYQFTHASINRPRGIDVNGNMVAVASRSSQNITLFDLAGNYISHFATNAGNSLEDVEIFNNRIYVTHDGLTILVFDMTGILLNTIIEKDNKLALNIEIKDDNLMFLDLWNDGILRVYDTNGNFRYDIPDAKSANTIYLGETALYYTDNQDIKVYEFVCPDTLNDLCGGAILIPDLSICDPITVITTHATNDSSFSTQCFSENDLWYKFIATSSTIQIEVPDTGFVPPYDTYFELFDTCGSVFLNCIPLCYGCSFNHEDLNIGSEYYLKVSFTTGVDQGDFCIKETCTLKLLNINMTACNPTDNTFDMDVEFAYENIGIGDNIFLNFGNYDFFYNFGTSTDTQTVSINGIMNADGSPHFVELFHKNPDCYAFGPPINFPDPCVVAPANDSCQNAIIIADVSTCISITADVKGASTEGFLTPPFFGADVWYTFTADRDGDIIIENLPDTNFNHFSSIFVEVYSMCGSGPPIFPFQVVFEGQSGIIPNLTNGTQYMLRIQIGHTTISSFCLKPPPPPLANDDVCSATEVVLGQLYPGTFDNATVEPNEPNAPGGDCFNSWCNATLYGSVWYKFVAPASGSVKIETFNTNTKIALYDDIDCNNIDPFVNAVLLAANDDKPNSAPIFDSEIEEICNLTPDSTYYIQIDQFSFGQGPFDIIVNALVDTLAPNTACQNLTIYLDQNGLYTLSTQDTATIVHNTTDNCAIDSIGVSQSTFSCEDMPSTIVTLTFKDQSDNVSTCDVTVTVLDTIVPNTICNDLTIYLDQNGLYTLSTQDTVTMVHNTTDNCAIDSTGVSQSMFTVDDRPSTTMTLTFKDQSGNISTCGVTVTVLDTINHQTGCSSGGNLVLDNNYYSTEFTFDPISEKIFFTSLNTSGPLYSLTTGNGGGTVQIENTPFTGSHPYISTDIEYHNGNVYSIDFVNHLVSHELSTGNINTVLTIANLGIENGIASNGDYLYFTDGTSNLNNLYQYHIPTDSLSIIVNNLLSSSYEGLDYSITHDKIYLASHGNGFYEVDIDNNIINLISSFAFGNANFKINGNYAYGKHNGDIYRLDLTTGIHTVFADINGGNDQDVIFAPSITGSGISLYAGNGNNIFEMYCNDFIDEYSPCDTDIIPPEVTCHDMTLFMAGNAAISISISDIIDGEATDNCGIDSMSLDIDEFTIANLGTTVDVTLSVIDISNNIGTCVSTVSITDNPACPEVLAVNDPVLDNVNNILLAALEMVMSNAVVPANSNITFMARDRINLYPGFEVTLGAIFEAVIDDCGVIPVINDSEEK
ncbi:MAG: 3-coathanger stack domain-containing protein [Saprospiraceae bacterium]